MAKKGRNVARVGKNDRETRVTSKKIKIPTEPVALNMSPTVEEMLSGTSPFSRTEISRVGALGGTPNSSEEITGINISQREGDRIQRSEYKMPSEKKPIKPKPRPDVGAIERGNRAAKRTAQDLSSMEDGGVAGGKVPKKYKGFSKLPEKVQEKISPDLAEKYEFGGEVKGKKGKKSKVNICRGGGAALRGTKFSGVR
jgi:hypothetical protein